MLNWQGEDSLYKQTVDRNHLKKNAYLVYLAKCAFGLFKRFASLRFFLPTSTAKKMLHFKLLNEKI